MNNTVSKPNFFDSKVLGHPSGLFVLFFTEMWERFSFYGMRVLLVNFLTMTLIGVNPGWEWNAETATALFGTYAMLLYITPIAGGIIADKLTGYRWAVVIGALIMTLGHASMALETEASLYIGLALLVIGTGFFKPNMTSIISEMYKDLPEKKDGAYTIFYMGVNAGAFFGMMLCGYLAERIGWSWGFGLAGIFMMLGTIQFWLAKPLFGSIGEVPSKDKVKKEEPKKIEKKNTKEEIISDKRNPFKIVDIVLIIITSIIGLGYAINDPLSKITGTDLFVSLEIGDIAGQYVAVLFGLVFFLYLTISRIIRYERVVRDRMIAVIVFAFFTVFFWMSFEQGASSLVLFARDFTDRTLEGGAATIFNIINTLLTVVPLAIISWVLFLLFKKTYKKIGVSNIVLASSFLVVWGLVVWMLMRDVKTKSYEISYQEVKVPVMDNETNKQKLDENNQPVFQYLPVTESFKLTDKDEVKKATAVVTSIEALESSQEVLMNYEAGQIKLLDKEFEEKVRGQQKLHKRESNIFKAKIEAVKEGVEVTVSWFSILNSFFIIAFANLFSKWWDSKYNPSASIKYGLGLIIMALGFGLLAVGTLGIEEGAKVSMFWLIGAYLFHTLGELCLSPVGLSYVSKLVPPRMIAFMFGMWYLAIAIGNKLAAVLGGQIENITKEYSLNIFFLIFTVVPIVAGTLVILLNPFMKKLMHGVK